MENTEQQQEQPQEERNEARNEGRNFGRNQNRPERRGGPRRQGGRPGGERESWVPVTKLGRLVKAGYFKNLEEIYKHALPIKEAQIIDHFLGEQFKHDILKVKPVQKQTQAGQRTRFMAVVVAGDENGHVGLGCKVSKEVAKAIQASVVNAKLSMVPVRFGYWGNKIGLPHTVPCKVTGKCGSVMVRLIPAPRGAGIVAAPVPKRLLEMSGIKDVVTASVGSTSTVLNFAMATFKALSKTYQFLTPEQWTQKAITLSPYQQFSNELTSKW